MIRWMAVLCLIVGFAAAVGCTDGVKRQAVAGSVTLDGAPLENGSILFTPLGAGPSSGGEITAGRYELSADRGPSPGNYRVAISAWRLEGPVIHDEATGTSSQQPVSIIPPRYNTQSQLEVTIEEGGDNVFDFQLSSS